MTFFVKYNGDLEKDPLNRGVEKTHLIAEWKILLTMNQHLILPKE